MFRVSVAFTPVDSPYCHSAMTALEPQVGHDQGPVGWYVYSIL